MKIKILDEIRAIIAILFFLAAFVFFVPALIIFVIGAIILTEEDRVKIIEVLKKATADAAEKDI